MGRYDGRIRFDSMKRCQRARSSPSARHAGWTQSAGTGWRLEHGAPRETQPRQPEINDLVFCAADVDLSGKAPHRKRRWQAGDRALSMRPWWSSRWRKAYEA